MAVTMVTLFALSKVPSNSERMWVHSVGLSSSSSGRWLRHERSGIQSVGKEVRDVPMVAGGAGRGAAGLPAVLREGRGGARAMHGLERPVAHARDGLPALGEVGEAVNL